MKLQTIWIEFPVRDIERATAFYGTLFDAKFDVIDQGVRRIAIIGTAPDVSVGLSLNQTANFEPSTNGAFVHFSAGDNPQELLARVAINGGKVVMPRDALGMPNSYYAAIEDSEGNRFGLVWSE